jgi:hypothetical protein
MDSNLPSAIKRSIRPNFLVCHGDDPRWGQETRKIQGIWLTLCRLTKVESGRNIRASARPAYKCIPTRVRYAGITGILIEECRHMHRYAGLTYLICCAGAGEAGLPDLHRSLIRHIDPGYGQRSYPGYRSQPRCHIPVIKEENIPAWKQSMMTGCIVRFTNPHCAQVQPLPHSGKVTVQELQGTGMWSPIESSQGQSQGSLPSSACPVWSVVGVSWSHVTIVTLATTI